MKNITYIIIAIMTLLLSFFALKSCRQHNTYPTIIQSKIDTIITTKTDTIYKTNIKYKTVKLSPKDSFNIYIDTIHTNGYTTIITDTIQGDTISGRLTTVTDTTTTIRDSIFVETPPKGEFYGIIGINTGIPSALLLYHKKKTVIITGWSNGFLFGIGRKIK